MACLASPEIGDCQRIVKPSEERVKELEEEVSNLFAQNEVLFLCIRVCLPPFAHCFTPLQYSISIEKSTLTLLSRKYSKIIIYVCTIMFLMISESSL